MKNATIFRHSLILGASAVLLALGCGEGGPGEAARIDSPFGSPPPSDNSGVPNSSNNPFQGSSSSGGGFQPPSNSSSGFEAPSDSSGGFQTAPGGGANCTGSFRQLFDRCGLTDQILAEADQAALENGLAQFCAAFEGAGSCASCILPKLSAVSCDVFSKDDGVSESAAQQALGSCLGVCQDVEIKFDDNGQGGSSGAGGSNGQGGSNGEGGSSSGGDLCSRCASVTAACPDLGISANDCLANCGSAPAGCGACVAAAGTDCNQISVCLQSACAGGDGGSNSGGSSSGGATCTDVAACCPALPEANQATCNAVVENGQESTCSAYYSSIQSLCGGG